MTTVWGHPSEVGCRPHDWADPVCSRCGTFRCAEANRSGRCTNAVGHPDGTFHRFPDLWSTRVDVVEKARKTRRKDPPPDLQPA